MENLKPFFSIGVTTYNRKELLRQSLLSLLNQDFDDFEIIVGNDFISDPLTPESIGFNDPRIIIVNNQQNLGELGNMNSLLRMAQGRYFTWQFDDDLCAPDFLSTAHQALAKSGFPLIVISSFLYVYGEKCFNFPEKHNPIIKLYSGRDFLRSFLSGGIMVLGSAGFYATDYLRNTGGAVQLSKGRMAVYSEYLLIFKAGLLDKVAYISSKLVAFRVHGNSWSGTCDEAEMYMQAGINLVRESIKIFTDQRLEADYDKNLDSLLKSVISLVITKNRLAGIRMKRRDLDRYFSLIQNEFEIVKQPELKKDSMKCLSSAKKMIFLFRLKAWLKTKISIRYLKYAHSGIALISRYTNKSF